MDFAQNLAALMERKGVSAYRMSVDLEISDSLIGYWRRGQKMPGAKNLAKLASYFGVTTDYLLGKEQKEKPTPVSESRLNAKTRELLAIVESLSPETQTKLIEIARLYAEDQRRRKEDN